MNSNQISKAVRYALAASAVSALAAPSAFAADATTTDQNASNANQTNTAQLGKIEVTGTRIKRTDVETAQPVTIISSQQIKATGLNSVGDILANMPQVRSVLNAQVNNGNDGSSTIDLRDLGANRVLVLVNGRRWVGGISGIVDFNTIPAAAIDHIEILQDGASAIYGSDAISGVVNIITLKNFNGAEANAYVGTYHGDGHTDGKAQAYDFTIGTSGDKSAVLMSVSYTNQTGLLAGDRDISKEPYVGTGSATGSSRTPAGRFRWIADATGGNGQVAGTCPSGVAAKATKAGPLCDLTLISFPATPSLTNFRSFAPADHYNFAPLNYLVAPTETTNLYVQGHYDLADNLTFTTEALFSNRSSHTQLAQPVLDVGSQTNTPSSVGIDKTNPYNPFGVTFTSNSSAACLAAASCDLLHDWGRRYVEAGPRNTDFSQNTFHYAGGFKGFFNIGGNEWDWDAGYNFNRQDETSHESNVVDLYTLGLALGPAFLPAGAANIPTNYQCGTAANPIGGGCVPLNPFGGAGSLTPAMVNYTTFNPVSTSGSSQRDYTADLTGDIADLPAGPLGMALGAEYLEVNGFFHPDPLSVLGLNAEGSSNPTDGRESTRAEYVEFSIPILADQPFAKDMDLDIAERWSQFKWIGGTPTSTAASILHNANTSTGRAALKWQTTDSFLFRASWSQGFRLPEISELFANQASSAVTVTDPCTSLAFATAHPLCGGQHGSPGNGQINTLVGGNPGLNPEHSISRTVGFVYNPDWFPGFDFSADYFKIDIEQYVTSLSDSTILNNCYVSADPTYCALIQVKGGTIVNITNTITNIGSILTEGVDVSTHYKFPSTSAGDFKLGLDMTFMKEFTRTVPNTAFASGYATSSLAGWATQSGSRAVAYPKQKGDVTLDWNFGPWSAQYMLRYIGAMWEACNVLDSSNTTAPLLCSNPHDPVTNEPSNNGFVGRNHLGATIYHDVNVTYHFDSINSDFTFGVRNLFGKNPPVSQQAFANSYLPIYDTPGQFLYARLGVKF